MRIVIVKLKILVVAKIHKTGIVICQTLDQLYPYWMVYNIEFFLSCLGIHGFWICPSMKWFLVFLVELKKRSFVRATSDQMKEPGGPRQGTSSNLWLCRQVFFCEKLCFLIKRLLFDASFNVDLNQIVPLDVIPKFTVWWSHWVMDG